MCISVILFLSWHDYKPFMKINLTIFTGFLLVNFFLCAEKAYSQDINWTHFRGNSLNGVAGNNKIPLVWNENTIKWKTEIHDRGHSSPVVFNDQIWMTTATSDGRELYAVCADFNTGRIIYDIKVFTPGETQRKHSLNTYATPTPCIEEGSVFVHYGSMGTACINTGTGKVLWQRTDLKCEHVQGPASSPVLYKNLVILHFEGTDVRYLVALDKKTGTTVWRTDRPAEPYEDLTVIGRKAYVTPLLIKIKGRDMLISNGSAICIAYDPGNGKEIWRVTGGAESTVSMPFTEDGIVYWYTGPVLGSDLPTYNEILAVNPVGDGDITGTNIIWRKQFPQSNNQMLTPVLKDGLIYTVDTRHKMMCLDAKNGEQVWSTNVKSNFNASPLFIDGRVWFFSVRGEALVLKAGRNYEVINSNQLDSGIWATPAVLRNSIIVRTEKYLYRISN